MGLTSCDVTIDIPQEKIENPSSNEETPKEDDSEVNEHDEDNNAEEVEGQEVLEDQEMIGQVVAAVVVQDSTAGG